jgi:hypothetical protein
LIVGEICENDGNVFQHQVILNGTGEGSFHMS